MIDELEGGEKKAESMLGLMRARKFLQRRFGSVFVNFGEPISLAQALEGRRELFRGEDPAGEPERRALVERLGQRDRRADQLGDGRELDLGRGRGAARRARAAGCSARELDPRACAR